VAIGQGQVSVTPASLAVMISTVANGGTRVTPHVIKAVNDGNGWKSVPALLLPTTWRSNRRLSLRSVTDSGWW
jgi:penicillin-binding protein 2